MDDDTRHWLSPMFTALLTVGGGATFGRFIETVVNEAPRTQPRSVDWVRVVQLMREELAWDDYPTYPQARGRGAS